MDRLSALDWIALILVIVGGLNWLLVGLFGFNLVTAIFGDQTVASRVVYVLVGLGALWVLVISPRLRRRAEPRTI